MMIQGGSHKRMAFPQALSWKRGKPLCGPDCDTLAQEQGQGVYRLLFG